jgi:hypothetical protein
VTNGRYLAELVDAMLQLADEETDINGIPVEFQTPEIYKGYRFFSAVAQIPAEKHIREVSETRGKSRQGIILEDFTFDVPENCSDEYKERLIRHNAEVREILATSEMTAKSAAEEDVNNELQREWSLKTLKRASWLCGRSLSYCLAVSDDVAAFAAGLSPVDTMQRLKNAIDRNTMDNNTTSGNTGQIFPETTLVFTMPTEEQLRLLSTLAGDTNWWAKDETPSEDSSPDEFPSGRTDNLLDVLKQLNLSPRQIRVQTSFTDTSRTDKLRIKTVAP